MGERTPGPWEAYLHGGNACIKAADGKHIGYGYGHDNARFIAAAPDMEAVLERFVYHWNEIDIEARRELMTDARAALAKARGGSHGT